MGKKSWIMVVFLVLQWPLLASGFDPQESRKAGEAINWDRVRLAFRSYDQHPTEANAESILAAIPKPRAVNESGDREFAVMAIFDCLPFDRAVVSGNSHLAEAAFRLLGYVSGGALDEELRIMLGRFLIRKPEAFLRLLQEYRSIFPSEDDYPVDMTEIMEIIPDISSEEDSRRMESMRIQLYNDRIRALQSVGNADLNELKDACLKVLKKKIDKISQRSPRGGAPDQSNSLSRLTSPMRKSEPAMTTGAWGHALRSSGLP